MARNNLSSLLFGVMLSTLAWTSLAEDIDLYVGGEAVTGAETNVVIFLDNSANWSNASGWPTTQGEAELDALKAVIDTLDDNVNVGVMMNTRTGSTSGAYVRFAVRPMNAKNRAALKDVFDDIKSTAPNAPQDKVAQSANGDAAIEEVYRYFNSKALGFTAARDAKEDYSNNQDYYSTGGGVSSTLADKFHPATTAYSSALGTGTFAYAGQNSTTYQGPSSASAGCAKNYLIWVGNTSLDGSTDTSRLTAAATLINETALTSQIAVSGNSAPGSVMLDEWARFMRTYGVPTTIPDPRRPGHYKENTILTYTVDVFPADPAPSACVGDTSGGNQQIAQHYLMQSTATAGGGKCFPAANVSQLQKALQQIFAEIQAVNSVFASASLPVSVNTQGTYENQVYIGMFRPDASARPRWLGNLKEYKFGRFCDANANDLVDSGEAIADTVTNINLINTGVSDLATTPVTCLSTELKLFLADRNNDPANDQTNDSGFISVNATSFWSVADSPGFWSFFPDAFALMSDAPDGPLVERGGAAYKLRKTYSGTSGPNGPTAVRNVYTCQGSCLSTTATALSTQPFTFSSSGNAVTNALTVVGKNVTMVRSGNTVTATSSTAHGFNNGDTLTISGATTPAEYIGVFVISTAGPTSTTFTFTVPEKPTDDASGGAKVNIAQTAYSLSSITVAVTNWTSGAATATNSSNPGGFIVGDNLLITNATSSFLNSSSGAAVSALPGSGFSYLVTVPVPVSPATAAGKSQIGTNTYNNTSVERNQNLVVVNTGSNVSGVITTGSTQVTVSTVTPSDYNVSAKIIEQKGSGCNSLISGWSPVPNGSSRNNYYCYRLFSLTGNTATAQKILSTAVPVDISRTVGSQSATATLRNSGDPSLSGSTLTISGSVGYDGTWTMGGTYAIAGDGRSFTFGPVTLSPAQPSGTYTATPGASSTVVGTQNLINWVRGMDVAEDENQNASKTDIRASVHGDVLHSRPLMLNFGSTTGIVGFYGSNDALLHAIKGGVADTDGAELWSFIPDEFVSYSKLSRLYVNEPLVRFPNLSCNITPAPAPRDYFWDGVISGYQTPDGTATTAPSQSLIFANMRRGGQSVYALDVTVPSNPKFKWRVSNSQADFVNLGQTWSEVKVVELKSTVSNVVITKRAVVFGAGYDAAEEDKPAGSVRTPTLGGGVYVVDADNGTRLAFLQPPSGVKPFSFAGDVTPLDNDGDGYIDRIYAADTGGNLYRFDADQTQTPGTVWTAYHLAKLGDIAEDGGSDSRKFLFPPTIVPFSDPASGVSGNMILVGSGDREKPIKNPVTATCPAYYGGVASSGVPIQDRFYSVLDTVAVGAVATTVNASPIVESQLLNVNASPSALTAFDFSGPGWYISLKNDPDLSCTVAAPCITCPTASSCSLTDIGVIKTTCEVGSVGTSCNRCVVGATGDTCTTTVSLKEEKTVNAPTVVGGVLYFATNTPQRPDVSNGVCSNLGEALGYAVDPYTGLPVFQRFSTSPMTDSNNYAAIFNGGGLPPTVTSGVVMIGGQPYYGIIGSGGTGVRGNPEGGGKVTQSIPGTRKKVYWYYSKD